MPEDFYIKVGNLKTRYWALGNEGTPVILIHGLGASADIWMHNVEALAKQHQVYALDLAGFGRSDKPGPSFSPLDYAPFLDDFINALNMDRVSLVGQSLGGGVALHYAIQFPKKVDKLVLVGNAGLGKEVIWTLRLMSLPLVGELFSYPSRKGIEIFFRVAVRDRALVAKELVDLYYDIFSRPGSQQWFLKILRQIVNIRGAREEILRPIMHNLQKITQPVLIIWGEKDRVFPLNHAYFAKEKLRNAELEIMEGCGHLPFFERSEEFNKAVLSFLY